jgi:hypothetical protein
MAAAGRLWDSLREVLPEQRHVAAIRPEKQVADRARHRHRADQAIQSHIADHSQHRPGRDAKTAGLPDQVSGITVDTTGPKPGNKLKSTSAPKRMPVPEMR